MYERACRTCFREPLVKSSTLVEPSPTLASDDDSSSDGTDATDASTLGDELLEEARASG